MATALSAVSIPKNQSSNQMPSSFQSQSFNTNNNNKELMRRMPNLEDFPSV